MGVTGSPVVAKVLVLQPCEHSLDQGHRHQQGCAGRTQHAGSIQAPYRGLRLQFSDSQPADHVGSVCTKYKRPIQRQLTCIFTV